jgi:hypothetical protein
LLDPAVLADDRMQPHRSGNMCRHHVSLIDAYNS